MELDEKQYLMGRGPGKEQMLEYERTKGVILMSSDQVVIVGQVETDACKTKGCRES